MAVETLANSSSSSAWVVGAQRRLQKYAPAIVTFVIVMVLWEALIRIFDIKQFLLPAPSKIAEIFVAQFSTIYQQGFKTFQNALWGFAMGCGAGILVGAVSARFGFVTQISLPFAIMINAIPIIATAPIANQWFGLINPASKIAVIHQERIPQLRRQPLKSVPDTGAMDRNHLPQAFQRTTTNPLASSTNLQILCHLNAL